MLSSIVEHYTRLWERTQLTQADTCRLCLHSHGTKGHERCGHPSTHSGLIEESRKLGGACGPEAALFQHKATS